MKYRDYKIFTLGQYYHIYNRGNNKKKIFKDIEDYLNFEKRIKICLGIFYDPNLHIQPFPVGTFSIISYCLMPNHFHFFIRQNTDIGINKFIQKLCTSYTAYFNKKYNLVGHLFQNAFKAKLVENDIYAKHLSAYIHLNPAEPLLYPYSSLLDILGISDGKICDKSIILGWFENKPKKYKNYILQNIKDSQNFINHLLFEE